MYPSSVLCRAQQNAQLERAANAVLDNIRSIAEKAAAAWGAEAALAEDREQQRRQVNLIAADQSEQKRRARDEADEDRLLDAEADAELTRAA